MKVSQFSSSKGSSLYTTCCEGDVHCGILWYWWGNTTPCCTSMADGKYCLLLYVPAAPPSSSAQEKMTTLGSIESYHSSWQGKESDRCCCHGPFAPLVMGDSGTFNVLSWYESMWLGSLCQSERTTTRDPVQHKRWTYPCYRVVNMEHQQRWTHWWHTTPSNH